MVVNATTTRKAARKTIEVPCDKCSGKGRIEGFGHIENGKCFRCAGNKTFTVDAAKYARDVANAEACRSIVRVEQELSAWTGGYGAAERVAAAIVAHGAPCHGLVSCYLANSRHLRAELVAAYRAAKAAAR